MKKVSILFYSMFIVGSCWGQYIERDVIGAWGLSVVTGGIAMDATVGEVVISSLRNQEIYWTQGFHQPVRKMSTFIGEEGIREISASPNPSTNEVYLTDIEEVTDLKVFDKVGRVIGSHTNLEGGRLDISSWPSGVYTVRMRDTRTHHAYITRIVKE